MTKYKRVRRVIICICPNCAGRGTLITKHGLVPCLQCNGRGEVERIINEITHDDDVTD